MALEKTLQERPSTERPAAPSAKILKRATDLPHIFLIDWDDTGILREVAVVAEFADGTINGILVDTLHQIDKARLKKVISSIHANKYALWELMSQARLSNGLNCLDYMHKNFIRQKRPKGARMHQDSLSSLNVRISDNLIGSEFANPAEVNLDQNTRQFIQ
jgi:hypothetical protein